MSLFGTSPWNRWTNPGVQNLPDLPQGLQGVPSTTLPPADPAIPTAPATPTNIFRDISAFSYNPWTGSQLAEPWGFSSSASGLASIEAATSWQTLLNQLRQGLAQGASPNAAPGGGMAPSVTGGGSPTQGASPAASLMPTASPGPGMKWQQGANGQWESVPMAYAAGYGPQGAIPSFNEGPDSGFYGGGFGASFPPRGPVALPPPPSSPSSAPWTDWRGSPMPTRPPNPGMKWQLVVLPGAERQGATWQNVPLSTPDPVYGLL